MREMFERETALLHAEDKRQQKENLKLKEQDKKMKKQNDELKEQIVKLRQKTQNDNLKEQIVKLRRENQKLRRADSEIKQTIRQRDQNNSLEVTKMKNFIRQDDVHSELTKMMRNVMHNFLIEEKICVSGVSDQLNGETGDKMFHKMIQFGYSFPRKPTVSVSLSQSRAYGTGGSSVSVSSVTTSSADIYVDMQWGENNNYC